MSQANAYVSQFAKTRGPQAGLKVKQLQLTQPLSPYISYIEPAQIDAPAGGVDLSRIGSGGSW